jgi:hypothetical protein
MENFITENIERNLRNFELTHDLYDRYLQYCKFHKIIPVSERKFSFELRKWSVGVKHSFRGKYARWGVELLPCKY